MLLNKLGGNILYSLLFLTLYGWGIIACLCEFPVLFACLCFGFSLCFKYWQIESMICSFYPFLFHDCARDSLLLMCFIVILYCIDHVFMMFIFCLTLQWCKQLKTSNKAMFEARNFTLGPRYNFKKLGELNDLVLKWLKMD